MAEQLPEGTDRIIEDDGTAEARVQDTLAEGGAAGTKASGGPGGTSEKASGSAAPSESGSSAGGASGATWFDKIDDLKTQGYDSARAYAVSGKDRATGALDDLIRTVSDAAAQIDAKVGTSYGDYARKAVDSLGSFNDALKGKDVDELFNDARAMVAKAPAVAVGTAAALGFVIARLARAGLPEEGGAPHDAKSSPGA